MVKFMRLNYRISLKASIILFMVVFAIWIVYIPYFDSRWEQLERIGLLDFMMVLVGWLVSYVFMAVWLACLVYLVFSVWIWTRAKGGSISKDKAIEHVIRSLCVLALLMVGYMILELVFVALPHSVFTTVEFYRESWLQFGPSVVVTAR